MENNNTEPREKVDALTLQEAKDQVAVKHFFISWADFLMIEGDNEDRMEELLNEAAELYARAKWNQACEGQKESCFNSWWDYSCNNEHDEDGFRDSIKDAPKPEFKP